jgi:hypothetical protein
MKIKTDKYKISLKNMIREKQITIIKKIKTKTNIKIKL